MQVALDKGQSITNKLKGKTTGKTRLDEEGTIGLQDFLVRRDAVDDERLGVGKVEVTDEGRVGELAGPFAEELREPGNFEELGGLAEEEGIILTLGQFQ